MLTADKGETAQEIGYSCGIFEREDFSIYKVEEDESEDLMQKLLEINSVNHNNFGFMIAGNKLPTIFASKDESALFLKIIKRAKAIIVYRSSPA